jgi:NADPH:quinone reductase-like Zn-dependent oxidoreductase
VRVIEVDTPTPGDDELLVKVRATSVNRTDCGFRAAWPWFVRPWSGLVRPKAKTLGCEFAGEVKAVGREVTSFAVGDRVFGYSDPKFGAHAEFLTIAQDASVVTMPAGVTFEEVAPSTEGSHYALAYLQAVKIGSGSDVLVYGATGAVGTAAVQLAKSLGATVTAVCDTDRVAMVKGLGPDRVVDYTVEDFTQDQQSYDLVLDAVGKSSFGECRRLLKPGGAFASTDLGPLSQNPFLAIARPLLRGQRVLFPIPRHDQAMIQYFKGLLESGAFKPVIDRSYPLDQIVDAYRYVETGKKTGNVVITVGPAPPEGGGS